MFSIGEFARHGRVSVRMLRHYDAIGLIRPACVDEATGYRLYEASQLDELNRVIALKDLGFTLQQVQVILEEKVSAAELRGMLRLRRAEIQASIEAETTRLARVEARLLTIEDGARVPADGVVVKRLAPVRVAELTGVAAGYEPEAITPVIQPLYHDVWCRLASADIPAAGHAVAYSLFSLQERGRMFVSHGEAVYEGMIIGIHSRDNDLVVNPIKTKKLTNIRAAGKDDALILTPPIELTLEYAVEFIADDELVEVTPQSIRIRKRFLKETDRKRASRSDAA